MKRYGYASVSWVLNKAGLWSINISCTDIELLNGIIGELERHFIVVGKQQFSSSRLQVDVRKEFDPFSLVHTLCNNGWEPFGSTEGIQFKKAYDA